MNSELFHVAFRTRVFRVFLLVLLLALALLSLGGSASGAFLVDSVGVLYHSYVRPSGWLGLAFFSSLRVVPPWVRGDETGVADFLVGCACFRDQQPNSSSLWGIDFAFWGALPDALTCIFSVSQQFCRPASCET